MSLHEHEFRVLRETIATRGTVRMAIVPATIAVWAVAAAGLVLSSAWPVASLLSLAILVAGFEAVHALHVGVERIGRYLQVFYETGSDGPRWETTAMRLAPRLPGVAVDPLFTALFMATTLVNLLVVFIPPPGPAEAIVPVLIHLAVLLRFVRCRRAAARQRANDLQAFEAVRASGGRLEHGADSPSTD